MAKKFLPIAAAIGAVAGIVAGVLVAPKSGKETRADIKRTAGELKDKAVKVGSDTKSAAKDAQKDLKGKLKKRG